MTPAKQLPLEPPPVTRRDPTYRAIVVTAKDEPEYFVYRVTPKDERTPRNRAHRALGMYTGQFLRKPTEIRCHIDNANAIGPDVMGVQVMVLSPCELDEFWLKHPEV